MAEKSLVIGSRGSKLALIQADLLRRALIDRAGIPADAVRIETIRTTGDKVTDRPLRELGGKAMFTKEIETALLDGRIDIAIHSLKDLETAVPPGLTLAAVLERVDPRDALIAPAGQTLSTLPQGARFGTASPRRQAQIRRSRPDLEIALLRGNVDTRIEKIRTGQFDGTILAAAGLTRLGRLAEAAEIFPIEIMMPAVGQGVIGIEARLADTGVVERLHEINHSTSFTAVTAERGMLAALGGDCHTPVGGHAEIDADGRLHLRARLLAPDASKVFETSRRGLSADAEAMGRDAGEELRRAAGEDFFAQLG